MNATEMKSGMIREYFMGFRFYRPPSKRSAAVENYIHELKKHSREFVPTKAPPWSREGFACLVAMSK